MLILKLIIFGLALSAAFHFPTLEQVRAMPTRKAWLTVALMYVVMIGGGITAWSLSTEFWDSFRNADPAAVWQGLEDHNKQHDAEPKPEIEK